MGPTEMPERDSTRVSSHKAGSNGYKLKGGKFKLAIRKKFFTLRMVRHRNSWPREVVDTSSVQRQDGWIRP